jgi:Subtilase family
MPVCSGYVWGLLAAAHTHNLKFALLPQAAGREFHEMRLFCVVLAMAIMAIPMASAQSDQGSKHSELTGGDAALLCMTTDLLQARAAVLSGAPTRTAAEQFCAASMRGDQIQVDIGCDDLDATVNACKAAGLEVIHTFDDFGCRSVSVLCDDPTQLDGIAHLASTRLIAAAPVPRTNAGLVGPQADPALNAFNARTGFGITGAGVRVGVLSDSFIDLRMGGGVIGGGLLSGSLDQVSGDLPASILMIDAGPGLGSDEGNAMAQLVYDAAPGCDIAFASAFTSYAAFASNITALRTDGIAPSDIIVDDVYYNVEPVYQDGPIALAYENAYAAGVPCFSSAGNNADNSWEGAYADSNAGTDDLAALPTGNDLHDFDPGAPVDRHFSISLANNETTVVTLIWNQPYAGTYGAGAGSEADLDLFLTSDTVVPMTSPGNIVASNTNLQGTGGSPAGPPFEWLQYQNTSGSTQTYYIAVEHYDGVDPTAFYLDINGGTITDASWVAGSRTIVGHTAAANVESVAAAPWFDIEDGGIWSSPGQDPFAVDPESFTAYGGSLPFYYDGLGAPLPGAPVFRSKPDLTAPDGSNTTFFGQVLNLGGSHGEPDAFPNFFGTSAAAPHAAAVAALMLENAANNSLSPTPAQIYSALETTAIDMNTSVADGTTPGWDPRTGPGYVDALLANGVSGIPVELSVFQAD